MARAPGREVGRPGTCRAGSSPPAAGPPPEGGAAESPRPSGRRTACARSRPLPPLDAPRTARPCLLFSSPARGLTPEERKRRVALDSGLLLNPYPPRPVSSLSLEGGDARLTGRRCLEAPLVVGREQHPAGQYEPADHGLLRGSMEAGSRSPMLPGSRTPPLP